MNTKSVMIVGVGGQGSLLASKLLGRLLTDEGYDVKVSEVHGMSQRGGSVVTYVRFGEKVYSPIVTEGEADIIIAFEKLEAARYAKFLSKNGKIVVSSSKVSNPVYIKYGFSKSPFLNIYNKDGYLMSPFRTDSFNRDIDLLDYSNNPAYFQYLRLLCFQTSDTIPKLRFPL